MNADYVENIIRNIDKQSYKCILVDGAWGIGKSYVVEKALEDKKDRTCMVSLFGMEDVQQIYHEILYQLLLHTSNGGKIVEFLKDSFRILGNFDDRAKNVSTILESHFSEEDMVNSITRKFDEGHIVVIDDLERCKESIELRDFFGVVEKLKSNNHIQVVLIANSEEITDKKDFEKYREKVIDRTFTITENSKSANWSKLGIQGDFADELCKNHPIKNLRTLQNYFESRVKQYLLGIKSSDALINELYSYYESKRPLTEEDLKVQHKLFVEVGIKPNFYKTDDEIAEYLKSWKEKLTDAKTSYDLTMTANELDTWWCVLNDDDGELLDTYKSMLMTVFAEEFSGEGVKRVSSYDSQYFMNINQSISESYNEVLRTARENLADKYIEYLRKRIDDKCSEEYAGQLSIWHFERARMSDILEGKLDEFLDRKYFPLAPMNQYKENSSYTLLAILFDARKEQLFEKYEELKPTFSKMDRYRTEHYFEVLRTSHR